MKIKVKYHDNNCKIERHGNWFDLKAAESIEFKYRDKKLIPLGVSINLPKWYEANIVPRSSLGIKKSLILLNSKGIIDGPDSYTDGYVGDNDIWHFPAYALSSTNVAKGERICQFKVVLNQSAPWYIKLLDLFRGDIKIVEVDCFNNKNRGGFGQSGGYKIEEI